MKNIQKCFEEYGRNIFKFVSDVIFNLTTYDDRIDELFAKSIIEVCKVILNRENFEYIKNEENYVKYIIVCNLLEQKGWIDWGTSIRGAWFDYDDEEDKENAKPLCYFEGEPILFTKENLNALIQFVEKKENGKDN